jgi:valyl-tRNA synthetase
VDQGRSVQQGRDRQKPGEGVLLVVLETILKLIHPITPFVTEEIWSVLPGERGTLMTSSFPEQEQEKWRDPAAEEEMAADGCHHRYPQYPFGGGGASLSPHRGLCHL